MNQACQVCGASEWLNLPNPAEGRAVTTAGRIVGESLGKAQCAGCGFVQRVHAQFLGDTDYYEQDYAKYYDRPGTTRFHVARYRVLAEWMESVLPPLRPSRILDVGCGQGWAMEAMRVFHPDATIEGLEPSEYNTRVAREKGFTVYEARAGKAELPAEKYDLVFSNNVIQHVTDARDFLASLKAVVADDGAVIITCPDGSEPNIEILWADQNFSFLPAHLVRLCGEAGFETVSWFPSPQSPSVPPAQMLFLSKGRLPREGAPAPEPEPEAVYRAKSEYLGSFKDIDAYLCARTEGRGRVFNFGASYWSSILAAYCPRYWERVTACLVDEAEGAEPAFMGKEVLEMGSVTPGEGDALVFGTSPSTHRALEEKFSSSPWADRVAWDNFPPRY